MTTSPPAGAQHSNAGSPLTRIPDLKALRLRQDFATNIAVRKMVVQVPVTNPQKGWFVRTRFGEEWRAMVPMIVVWEEHESYVVDQEIAKHLGKDVNNFVLVTAINRHGTVFLWPLRVPNDSGRDFWAESAIAACARAETCWLRTTSNAKAKAYDVSVAIGKLSEPVWPEENFETLFRIAFSDHVIDSLDHPVVRQLKGAA